MKVCSKCKRELDESMFHKRKESKDGLRSQCKECVNAHMRIYTKTARSRELVKKRKIAYLEKQERKQISSLGGYKIYILNYAKKGESRYNVVSTNGEIFKTNTKQEFMEYLEAI